MEVTIFQINKMIVRLSNVTMIVENEEDNTLAMWLEDPSFKKFDKDLIAQIKIGGKHEYKKG